MGLSKIQGKIEKIIRKDKKIYDKIMHGKYSNEDEKKALEKKRETLRNERWELMEKKKEYPQDDTTLKNSFYPQSRISKKSDNTNSFKREKEIDKQEEIEEEQAKLQSKKGTKGFHKLTDPLNLEDQLEDKGRVGDKIAEKPIEPKKKPIEPFKETIIITEPTPFKKLRKYFMEHSNNVTAHMWKSFTGKSYKAAGRELDKWVDKGFLYKNTAKKPYKYSVNI